MSEPTEELRPDRVEIYRDASGEWRWRRKAPNGEVVADSSEGYVHREAAHAMALRVNGADVEFTVVG